MSDSQVNTCAVDNSSFDNLSSESSLSKFHLDNTDQDFQINLDFFSGPMDLLLHLVSQREVSIEEVSLKEVLDQYLEIVLAQADNLDLEKASEYLVIAATLLVIKSRSLIPQNSEEDDLDDDTLEYSRFFEDLRARLLAYENTRLRAAALVETPQLDVDTFVRRDKSAFIVPPEMIAEGEEPQRLGKLFLSLVKRIGGLSRNIRISIEPISIVSSMMKLVDGLKSFSAKGPQSLLSLNLRILKSLRGKRDHDSPRNIVLGSFIAVLELAKRGLIKVNQDGDYGQLNLELSLVDMTDIEYQSEFDEKKNDKVVNIEDYQLKQDKDKKDLSLDNEELKIEEVSNG